MRKPPLFSVDTRGLTFFAKSALVVTLTFVGVQYGTALGYEQLLPGSSDSQVAADAAHESTAKNFPAPTFEEAQVLTELENFEEQLSTRTIASPSVESLAQAHHKFIAADLGNMKLYLFEDGHATATLPILSKGKRGSRWETPTGLYVIQTRETDHFSSIGEVHMPYSMQFFGNFFIHGWPYYPSGEPVPEGFSGGCIRLSTADAAHVFDFARIETPIFIWDSTDSTAPLVETSSPPPKVGAAAYIVADIRTGSVYAEKDADTKRPIASISKLLTALVANETIHYDKLLTITPDDRAETLGTPGSLPAGATFTVGDLLHPLLMESNNSIAYTFARYHGSHSFMQWVNAKARAIGMLDTRLEDPSGISANNLSTASDLFKLTRYIYQSQSFILNISRQTEKTIISDTGSEYSLANFNHFAGQRMFLGGKTGYTNEAGETMTTIFEVPTEAGTSTVAVVVLDTKDRKADIERLVAWFKKAARPRQQATSTVPLL